VKIIDRPPQSAGSAPPASPPEPVSVSVKRSPEVDPNWVLGVCPPPAGESINPGDFIANGPCRFDEREAVSCEAAQDDLYVAFTRKESRGATLVVYLNVEMYRGPGAYDGVEMFMAVENETMIDRWSNDNAHVTVGPGEGFVAFPATRLAAEPMLVDCIRMIEPATNYQFQCGGRRSAKIAIDNDAEIVSGTLKCLKGKTR
jgi:hypothetical protein